MFELEEIDRALTDQVRVAVVAAGHYPDINLYLPTDDLAGFEAAKQAIVDAGRELIEVFGVGGFRDRKQLKPNNVIVSRLNIEPGDEAYSAPIRIDEYQNEAGQTRYRKVRTPDGPEDIEYEVRFVCDSIQLERLINKIMLSAYPQRCWLRGVRSDQSRTAQGFWVLRNGPAVDMSEDDYIERVWRFRVKNVMLAADVVLRDDIKPISELQIEVGALGAAGSEPAADDLTGVVAWPEPEE